MAKKPITIFYSWQKDLPNPINRGFIEDALKKASMIIMEDTDCKIVIDKDTRNVAGAPEIHHTIFEKIKNADILVADVSIINCCSKERKTPNPNVLVELGYALSQLGKNRLILVHNLATGRIEDLPFDINKMRITDYTLVDSCKNKGEMKKELVNKLKSSIKEILKYAEMNPKQGAANLHFGFADYKNRKALASIPSFENVFYSVATDSIPDFMQRRGYYYNYFYENNDNYYREMLPVSNRVNLCNDISFFLDNKGIKPLSEIKIEVIIPDVDKNIVIYDEELSIPEKEICKATSKIDFKSIKPLSSHFAESSYNIRKTNTDIIIEFYLKNLQPSGRYFFEGIFSIGSKATQDMDIEVIVRANELHNPWRDTLNISFKTEVREVTIQEFIDIVNSLEN